MIPCSVVDSFSLAALLKLLSAPAWAWIIRVDLWLPDLRFGNRLGSRSSIVGGGVLLAIAVKIMFYG